MTCPLSCDGKRCELTAAGDDWLDQSHGLRLPAKRWACPDCPRNVVVILPTGEPAMVRE